MDPEHREAQQRAQARQAAERALFELDRMPEPRAAEPPAPPAPRSPAAAPPATAPAAAAAPPAPAAAAPTPAPGPASSSASSPLLQQPPAAARPAAGAAGAAAGGAGGAYRPPGWATAPQGQGEGPVVESDGISLSMCGCGNLPSDGSSIDQQLFAMAGLHPPSEASFSRFFRTWFEMEFFPSMSKALQKELVARARSKGFFSGLSSQVKKWAMANTDARLQSDAWCSYFEHHAPPRFRTIGCVRSAAVNLGSQVAPCWATFWGLPDAQGDRWVLPPWTSTTPDIGAVVDELDGRGGMAALVAAAA